MATKKSTKKPAKTSTKTRRKDGKVSVQGWVSEDLRDWAAEYAEEESRSISKLLEYLLKQERKRVGGGE